MCGWGACRDRPALSLVSLRRQSESPACVRVMERTQFPLKKKKHTEGWVGGGLGV